MSLLGSRSRTVAIVEDDEPVLNSLEFALAAEGYEVLPFRSAGAAFDSLRIAEADCLIIDYGLPDFDGVTLLRLLRSRGVQLPAAFIVSSPTLRHRREIDAVGAPLIEKPLTGDHLFRFLRRAFAEGDAAG